MLLNMIFLRPSCFVLVLVDHISWLQNVVIVHSIKIWLTLVTLLVLRSLRVSRLLFISAKSQCKLTRLAIVQTRFSTTWPPKILVSVYCQYRQSDKLDWIMLPSSRNWCCWKLCVYVYLPIFFLLSDQWSSSDALAFSEFNKLNWIVPTGLIFHWAYYNYPGTYQSQVRYTCDDRHLTNDFLLGLSLLWYVKTSIV